MIECPVAVENPTLLNLLENVTEDASLRSPFMEGAFLDAWRHHLGPKYGSVPGPNHWVVYRKPVLKGAARLLELRMAGWNTAWYQTPTPEQIAMLPAMRSRKLRWDCMKMTVQAGPVADTILSTLADQGYVCRQKPAPCQYAIHLSPGLEAYMQSLSRNARKSLTKKLRLSRPLNPYLKPVKNARDLQAFFDVFFPQHIVYWQAKTGFSYFSDPAERAFMEEWAYRMLADGILVADMLMLDDRPANLSLGFRHGPDFYWWLTLNTGVNQELAPGMTGLYLRLEQAERDGVRWFHMGGGDYFYKQQLATHTQSCVALTVCNPASLTGQLYEAWLRRQAEKDSAAIAGESAC